MRPKDTIEHRLRKAEIFIEKGQYRNAVKIYEKTIEMCPENAEVWNNFGIALEGVGRYEDAVGAYEHALAINPSLAWFWSNKGNALDELGRYEESIKAFDKAIEIDPSSKEAWSNKSVILGKLGRFEDAIKCSNRALEIDPDFAGAWYNRGLALQGLADAAFARAEKLGLKIVDERIHLTKEVVQSTCSSRIRSNRSLKRKEQ